MQSVIGNSTYTVGVAAHVDMVNRTAPLISNGLLSNKRIAADEATRANVSAGGNEMAKTSRKGSARSALITLTAMAVRRMGCALVR